MTLPPDLRDRTPAPHALRVGLRNAGLPSAVEVAAFCLDESPPAVESGPHWIRLTLPEGRDHLLILDEGVPGPMDFDHSLVVESTRSKLCFLAAYFVARRCGGVITVRQRGPLPAGAFADRYLGDEDLDLRWSRSVSA